MTADTEYSDDVLIARAIENGWKQCVGVTDEWPGSVHSPFTGWKKRTSARHMEPGREYTEWIGEHPNRVKRTYVATWAHEPRKAFSHEDRCAECGLWIEYGSMFGYMGDKSREFCWDCNHWLQRVADYTEPDPHHKRVVIDKEDGRHIYSIGNATRPSSHNGFGGAWFTILFNDGTERRTCDLWSGGSVPERFRDRIPSNAQFKELS
jgi:hypothetical protein